MAKNSVNPNDESALSVRTIDSKGKAPKRRIATATAAWTACNNLLQTNLKRDGRFGDIAGIFAGFPPTPPASLERNGQADMPNVNTKQFQAKVGTYVSTWTAINAQGDGFAEVLARHEDPMEAERRGKVLTEEFNAAIRLWDAEDDEAFENGSQYVLECAGRDTQMGLFGIGLAFMRDSIDFRFRTIPTRRVLIPDGTRITLDNCPGMYIRDTMSVTDLYGMCDKPGWNKGAILRNLYEHVEQQGPQSAHRYTYSEWVNQIRNNDTWILSDFLPVQIIHGFVKEFDGTITHFAFTDLYGSGTTKDTVNKEDGRYKEDSESFIYDKMNVAKRWSQVLIPFADNAGPECDWHGVKGFGDLIFDGCHLNNLMFNRAAIGGVMTNLLMFKGMAENDTQKLDQITFTQFGIMAPGLEFEQVKFAADIDGAMTVFNAGTQVMSENTRIAPQNEKTVTSEQPTATQVTADRADRAQFTTLQIAIYRAVGQDPLFSEMYRRIAQPASKYPESWGGGKVAKRFRENCERRGIPVADLLKVKCVRANRNIGSGDLALDLMKGKELLGVATPGKGQMNARYEIACALKGPEMAEAFVEREEAPPGQDAAMLTMENNLIQLGQIPVAYGWQDQEAHVAAHMSLMGEAAQVVPKLMEAGIGPQSLEPAKKLNNLLAAGIGHVGQHLGLMAEVRRVGKGEALHERFIAEIGKQLHNLQQLNESLGEDIQKADVAQQPQESPEMLETKAKIAREDMLAQAEVARNEMVTKAKIGEGAVKLEAKTEMALSAHQVKLAVAEDTAHEQNRIQSAEAIVDLHNAQKQHALDLAAETEKKRLEIETVKKKAEAQAKAAAKKPKTPKSK